MIPTLKEIYDKIFRRKKIPKVANYKTYEILKQHIAETSKTHREYERRLLKLVNRLGI